MKVSIIQTLDGILSGVKINRIKDRQVKADLLRDYLALHRIAKAADEEKNAIIEKFQADWRDELAPVQAFRSAGAPVEGHGDYLDAEKDALETIEAVFTRDEEVELVKVKADALYDPDLWADDITLGQIPGTIDFLVENGVAE